MPIVIQPADKNLGLVVLDKILYTNEEDRQLSDEEVYESVEFIPWDKLKSRLEHLEYRLKILGLHLYFLPEVQKFTLVGRLIFSNMFLFDCIMNSTLSSLNRKNHLIDSLTYLREIFELEGPTQSIFITFDMKSLYPSILTELGRHTL